MTYSGCFRRFKPILRGIVSGAAPQHASTARLKGAQLGRVGGLMQSAREVGAGTSLGRPRTKLAFIASAQAERQ